MSESHDANFASTGRSVARRSAATALRWLREGERPVAVCQLAIVEGSAPLNAGAMMFVDAAGNIEGSITGGCVESAVAQEAAEVLEGGSSPRLIRYGISDDLAGTVGLMCGGVVHVLIQDVRPDDEAFIRYLQAFAEDRPVGIATLLDGPHAGGRMTIEEHDVAGALGGPELLELNVAGDLRSSIEQGRSVLRRYGGDGARLGGELRVQIVVHARSPQMVIVGAIDFAAALAPIAASLGYTVTICDPRAAFLASSRFDGAAETVARWPQELLRERAPGPRDAVLVFSHDPKIDVPAVSAALASRAGYVGALGSRRTARDREERLLEAGVGREELSRLHAPCGLDIGAASPEETAVAILAEIVAGRARRSGGQLRAGEGPIRARDDVPAQAV